MKTAPPKANSAPKIYTPEAARKEVEAAAAAAVASSASAFAAASASSATPPRTPEVRATATVPEVKASTPEVARKETPGSAQVAKKEGAKGDEGDDDDDDDDDLDFEEDEEKI